MLDFIALIRTVIVKSVGFNVIKAFIVIIPMIMFVMCMVLLFMKTKIKFKLDANYRNSIVSAFITKAELSPINSNMKLIYTDAASGFDTHYVLRYRFINHASYLSWVIASTGLKRDDLPVIVDDGLRYDYNISENEAAIITLYNKDDKVQLEYIQE